MWAVSEVCRWQQFEVDIAVVMLRHGGGGDAAKRSDRRGVSGSRSAVCSRCNGSFVDALYGSGAAGASRASAQVELGALGALVCVGLHGLVGVGLAMRA